MQVSRLHIILITLSFCTQLVCAQNRFSSRPIITEYKSNTFDYKISGFFQDEHNIIYCLSSSGVMYYKNQEWVTIKGTEGKLFFNVAQTSTSNYVINNQELGKVKYSLSKGIEYKKVLDLNLAPTHERQSFICSNDSLFVFDKGQIKIIYNDRLIKTISGLSEKITGGTYLNQPIFHAANSGLIQSIHQNEIKTLIDEDALKKLHIKKFISKDSLLISIHDQGVLLFQTNRKVKQLKLKERLNISDAILLDDSTLVVSTQEQGIHLYSLITQKLAHKIDQTLGLRNNQTGFLHIDHQKNIWVNTPENIEKIELQNPLRYKVDKDQITGQILTSILVDDQFYFFTTDGIYLKHDFDQFTKIKNHNTYTTEAISNSENIIYLTDSALFSINANHQTTIIDSIKGMHLVKINATDFFIHHTSGLTYYKKTLNKYLKFKAYKGQIDNISYLNFNQFIIQKKDKLYNLSFDFSGESIKLLHEKLISTDLKIKGLVELNRTAHVWTDSLIYKLSQKASYYNFAPLLFEKNTKLKLDKNSNINICGNSFFSFITLNDANQKLKGFLKYQSDRYCRPIALLNRYENQQIVSTEFDENSSVWMSSSNAVSTFEINDNLTFEKTGNFHCIIDAYSPKSLANKNVKYENSDLSFYFFSTNQIEEKEDLFSYQLLGASEQWSKWSGEKKIEFARLAEGSYTFRVKSKNIYGQQSSIAEYKFRILTPFYRSKIAYLFYIILLALLTYLIVQWYTIRLQKTNERLQQIIQERTKEIWAQKQELEEKNKSILSSIEYARTIQDAILTSQEYLKNILDDFFILYNPKDIIGGDFYWAYSISEHEVIVAEADCTGHGVPGALMSMIGNALLNEIVVENKIHQPNHILDQLRNGIINSFKHAHTQEIERSHDGMDISIIKIDKKTMHMSYAAAKQTILIIREGQFIETYNDFQPVSNFITSLKPYQAFEVNLQKGDQIYLCSDGYADQFGGKDGKKLKQKYFKEFLLNVSASPFKAQRAMLEQNFNNWRGVNTDHCHDQIDDICIVGIKIN